MSFNKRDCIIPTLWCGNSNVPANSDKKVYSGAGTPYQCMKKGFGAGSNIERVKQLKKDNPISLEHIKYVGPVFNQKFRKANIYNIIELISEMKKLSKTHKEVFLKNIFLKKDNTLDTKAYNSTLEYLSDHINNNLLPQCIRLY